jgi:outer membrane protein, heavy metal efflux system
MLPRFSRAVAGLAMTCVMVPLPTRADDGVAPATLDEATFLRRVLERSPRRAVHDERRRAASAAVDASAVWPNPTLGYEREAVPALDASDQFVRLGWTLDVAGRRGLARDAASAGAAAERAEVDRDARALEVDARAAYLDASYAKQRAVSLEQARTAFAAVVDMLRSRAKQGDASDYDAERAALDLDALDDERADAARELATARLRLGAWLGEPAMAYDTSDAFVLPPRPTDGPLRSAEVEAARARARQAAQQAVAAGRGWMPRFELVAGMLMSRSAGGDGVGYVVGVGGELPLLDRGGAAARRSRAEAKRWQAEATAATIEAAATAEQARRELVARIEQADAFAATAVKRAADLSRRVTVAYREGDRPILELLDVQRSARQVALRALELVYEARRAELALQRARGGTP